MKPVLNFKIKNRGMNSERCQAVQEGMKRIKERLSEDYEVIVTPDETIDVSSNIGYNAININMSSIEDVEKLMEILSKKEDAEDDHKRQDDSGAELSTAIGGTTSE